MVIVGKMSLHMIAKVVRTGKDGIMMKPEDGTERKKGTTNLENVEDPMDEITGMAITGRGRSPTEKEIQRNPDIGKGQVTLKNRGWMRRSTTSAHGMEIVERKTQGLMIETEIGQGAEDEKKRGHIREKEIVRVRRYPG